MCTIYPENYSDEMIFNFRKLKAVPNLDIQCIFVEAGTFSHRHPRDKADPDQILKRQMYLDEVPTDEYILVMDSDEVLFGALDRIPEILNIMKELGIEVAMINEFLPDGQILMRPRIIKNIEGLSYGGPNRKHDVIWTCDHKNGGCTFEDTLDVKSFKNNEERMAYYDNIPCIDGYNYIDVANQDNERFWELDFLAFWHYKNGMAMTIYTPERLGDQKIPDNLLFLKEIENE